MPYIVTYQRDHMEAPETFGLGLGNTYETGAEASQERSRLALAFPEITYRVKQIAELAAPDWREREALRFTNGTYTPTPWNDEPFYTAPRETPLFAHMSEKKPGLVSFTESDAKGAIDRQAPAMAPGRFLTRYFPELGNDAIEAWAAKCDEQAGRIGLKITQDADEIEAVYVGGPESCMAYSASHFDGPCHPCRVYAGPDLALAYLGDLDDATARCVVWPDKMRYGRTYGDVSRITLALEGAGYSKGSLYGARVRMIEYLGEYVMPYVDGMGEADCDGEYIILGSGGIKADNQTGLGGPNFTCSACGDSCDEDNTYYIEDRGHSVCESCSDDAARCDYSGNLYSDTDSVVEVNGSGSYSHLHRDELSHLNFVELTNGEVWHMDYAAECARCCDVVNSDETEQSEHDDETRCDHCHDLHLADVELKRGERFPDTPDLLAALEAPALALCA